MVIRMIFCAFGVVGSCIDFKIGLIWDVLQCINMQALGIPKCVLNLDSLRPFQTEALLQGTDQLSIICLWVKNENH